MVKGISFQGDKLVMGLQMHHHKKEQLSTSMAVAPCGRLTDINPGVGT